MVKELSLRLGVKSLDDLLDLGVRTGFANLMEQGTRGAAKTLIVRGVREYFELAGEVIFEMAFDSVLRFDKSERPVGGGEAFFTAMTLSILTSGALSAITGRQRRIAGAGGTPSGTAARAVRGLTAITLGLQMGMLAMRIPVLTGNMR